MILQNILKIKCVEIRKKSERLGKIREIRKKSRRSEDPDKNWETLQLSGRVCRSAIRQRIGEVQSLKPAFHISFWWKKKKKSIKNQVEKNMVAVLLISLQNTKRYPLDVVGPFMLDDEQLIIPSSIFRDLWTKPVWTKVSCYVWEWIILL